MLAEKPVIKRRSKALFRFPAASRKTAARFLLVAYYMEKFVIKNSGLSPGNPAFNPSANAYVANGACEACTPPYAIPLVFCHVDQRDIQLFDAKPPLSACHGSGVR
jgi:hypothetical protein